MPKELATLSESRVESEIKKLTKPSHTRTSLFMLRAVLKAGGGQNDPF
jgi:hypothetical protein